MQVILRSSAFVTVMVLFAAGARAEGAKAEAGKTESGKSDSGKAIARLGWLAGCWTGLPPGREITEQWMAPSGGSMLGMSRTVAGGKTLEYEFLRIQEGAKGLQFISNPSGQQEAAFDAKEQTDKSILFENPSHDFPQRIMYQRQADGSLLARIEGTLDEKTRSIDFPMKRAKCPQGEP